MTIAATKIVDPLNRPFGAGFALTFDLPVVDGTIGIPTSFNDPMFGTMAESAAPVTLAPLQRLSHQSIIETGVDPTISCVGGNVLSYCRVNSRHCVLSGGGDLSILSCYLEATGEGADQSDTVQVASPGARSETITVANTMIAAHLAAARAGFYAGGDWGGAVVLDGVIFQGGPYGLEVVAEDGCQIDILLNNVYFVGPFGDTGGLFSFEDVGSGTHTVVQWQNVCSAIISDGVLIPGAPLAEPASSAVRLKGSDGSLLLGADGKFLVGSP